MAQEIPDNIAIAEPVRYKKQPVYDSSCRRVYRTITFRELDRESDRVASVLQAKGFRPGMRIVLMVRQGIDFITLVYALCKAGIILVMIDPGMGLKQMLACLSEVRPDGFVAIPPVHAVRCLLRSRFPRARFNLTVGRRWFWGGLTLKQIQRQSQVSPWKAQTAPDDPASIIFTSGSTGIAKGVLYTHRIFDTQVEEISRRYDIRPGGVDVACFPFFGLFNAAMGTTAVIPDMDPTHPSRIKPEFYLEAVRDWHATQSFGSPALWNRVLDYCIERGIRMESIRRAISAGAPISFALLEKFKKCLSPEAQIYTPYGATESLPVASIEATEVLSETFEKTRRGQGICVGRKFSKIEWRTIPITDEPIENPDTVPELMPGVIGELAVCGPQVTREYVTRIEANRLAKMKDSRGRIWHRIGDVGYIDNQDRFWFCGRKAHRVETEEGTCFSIPCEAIANEHPRVFRSALAGIPVSGTNWRIPVIIVEPLPQFFPKNDTERDRLCQEVLELLAKSEVTAGIKTVLVHPDFPVDVRHNAKINREQLSKWAAEQTRKKDFGGK